MGYQRVLVPVSGRYRMERAARALEQALRIVQPDGEIGFLHCVEEMPQVITADAQGKRVTGDTREAEKLLTPLAERAKDAGIASSMHIVEGSPVTHIPRFASEKEFHAVVMCTDGQNEPNKLAMGSLTARVFQYLRVPLLVVH